MRGVVFLLVLAAVVVGGIFLFAGPAFRDFALGMARDNPESLRIGPIMDVVRGHFGDKLTRPAGEDSTPIPFEVARGSTVTRIAEDLTDEGLIAEPLVFEFLVVTGNLDGRLQSGIFTLDETMTPNEIAGRLQEAPEPPPSRTVIALREGLRIEQIVAYLQTTELTGVDAQEFYRLATQPPADLRADYPFLSTVPPGRSLEGYLGSGVFELEPETDAETLLRVLLDDWDRTVGDGPIARATQQGRDFYEVMTLASIVERETGLDAERRLVAGVYLNRLDRELSRTGLLNADPTVIYANDTMQLRQLEITEWVAFSFWNLIGSASLNEFQVSPDLQGYQTYQQAGLPPGPIASPSLDSIEAALDPDTERGYLYFVACGEEGGHRFARNLRQHNRNVAECRAAEG
jgi:UPF0755 protein